MAENENGFLLKRIGELERQLGEANAEAKKRRIQAKTITKELNEIQIERDQIMREREMLRSSPSEWQAKYETLQKELRTRDHRDVWTKTIGEDLQDKVPLEEIWSKIGYQPGENVPSEHEIKQQAKAAREVAPYLFRSQEQIGRAPEPTTTAPVGAQVHQKPTAQVPFDASRGDRDTGQRRFVVRQSEMRDVNFMMANSKMISEASRKGILEIQPD